MVCDMQMSLNTSDMVDYYLFKSFSAMSVGPFIGMIVLTAAFGVIANVLGVFLQKMTENQKERPWGGYKLASMALYVFVRMFDYI